MPGTAFIVGAGASKELGLPTGAELTKTIAQKLNIRFDRMRPGPPVSGDLEIVEALRQQARGNVNTHLPAARRIVEAMPIASSIDTFLDAHRSDESIKLCGKLAIVRSILEAEHQSSLFRDVAQAHIPLDLERIGASWLKWFWRLLSEQCTSGQLAERALSVTFVVFNYDRCIEQFLYHAAKAYYGMQDTVAADVVSKVAIFHPYGFIAPLPWEDSRDGVEFGYADVGTQKMLELAGSIKTFTEQADPDNDEIETMRARVNDADRLVFMGFAYHRQNMELLWPANDHARQRVYQRAFGTRKGFSESDGQLIAAEISGRAAVQGPIVLRDLTCNGLLHEYSRSLAFL